MKLYFINTSFAIATMPSARDNVAATKGPPSRLRFMFHKQYNAQCEIQGNSHFEEGSCPIIAIAVAMARDLIVTGKKKEKKKAITFGTFAHVRKEKRKKGQSTQHFIKGHDHGYMRILYETSERQ